MWRILGSCVGARLPQPPHSRTAQNVCRMRRRDISHLKPRGDTLLPSALAWAVRLCVLLLVPHWTTAQQGDGPAWVSERFPLVESPTASLLPAPGALGGSAQQKQMDNVQDVREVLQRITSERRFLDLPCLGMPVMGKAG